MMKYFDSRMKHRFFDFYVKTSWFLLCNKMIGRTDIHTGHTHRHTHIQHSQFCKTAEHNEQWFYHQTKKACKRMRVFDTYIALQH